MPPTPVPSIQRGVMPSACATWTGPGAETVAMPSMSRSDRPASATAFSAPSTCSCRVEWSGSRPRRSVSAAPAMMTSRAPSSCGPKGPNTGRLTSPRGSNRTCSGMSSSSASGVAGSPTMLVIIRGPSASSTTAIAYGASSSKPGAGRWLIT